jgi:hypothetical protein
MAIKSIPSNELTAYDNTPLNIKGKKGVTFKYEENKDFFSKFNINKDWNIQQLGEMCNKMSPTLNGEYVVSNDAIKHNGETFYRPNHNSTHGVRSAVYLEKLFKYEKYFQSVKLTPQERNALRLGAILYRAGRVDESGAHQDVDKRKRCGEIFMKYASQFSTDTKWKEAINLVNEVISKPFGLPFKEGKEKYVGNLLNISHEMDLWRLWNPKLSEKVKPILKNEKDSVALGLRLDKISQDVTSATGINGYNSEFFEQTKDSHKCFDACVRAASLKINPHTTQKSEKKGLDTEIVETLKVLSSSDIKKEKQVAKKILSLNVTNPEEAKTEWEKFVKFQESLSSKRNKKKENILNKDVLELLKAISESNISGGRLAATKILSLKDSNPAEAQKEWDKFVELQKQDFTSYKGS